MHLLVVGRESSTLVSNGCSVPFLGVFSASYDFSYRSLSALKRSPQPSIGLCIAMFKSRNSLFCLRGRPDSQKSRPATQGSIEKGGDEMKNLASVRIIPHLSSTAMVALTEVQERLLKPGPRVTRRDRAWLRC